MGRIWIDRQLDLIMAVSSLVEIIRVVVALAAAEQRGRELARIEIERMRTEYGWNQ
jgi:hypothetical protein